MARRAAWITRARLMAALLSMGFASGLAAARAESPTAELPTEGLLNKLLAPGPLMHGHRKLEHRDCLECHAPRQGVPDAKCLACHRELRPFLEEKKGFHGLHTKACYQCHNDHQGRDHDTVAVDTERFDHRGQTGFALEGKHAKLKCAECHQEKRGQTDRHPRPEDPRYFGQKSACTHCHQKQDIHLFAPPSEWSKKDCSACHNAVSWKNSEGKKPEVRFDHEKDAHFALEGKHAEAKCSACHVPKKGQPSVYAWPGLKEKQCLACHTDPHGQKLSPRFQGVEKCQTCHAVKSWKLPDFDHSVTEYPLRGQHAKIDCAKCHKQPGGQRERAKFRWTGLKQDCVACHADIHRFEGHRLESVPRPKDCLSCHAETRWKDTHAFNHSKGTRFKLDGKHAEITCKDCHIQPKRSVYQFPSFAQGFCVDCHPSVHANQLSKASLEKSCGACHSSVTFRERLEFDHAATRFPLRGKHLEAKCEKCHVPTRQPLESKYTRPPRFKARFLFPEYPGRDCLTCHKDAHKGGHGTRCSECHEEKNWKSTRDYHRDFTLSGVHYSVACDDCHIQKRRLGGMSQNCILCHQKDDVHSGSLQKCAECHGQQFWEVSNFRHSKGNFPLRGVHRTLDCFACHTGGVYKGLNTNCYSCHLKDALGVTSTRAPHNPQLLHRNCAECHNQFSF